ncbi:lytic transglycosylase domain-containing protein [Phyllobacterium sp. P30BS-XVII]|uniref:lytic transglycosylase domain-containing protein n=1 Tax=Phyllobacterium sp. P30BS-XVII TaxID=2587046 RepID=UPI001849064A|nr:lytic transglycosylase domain-containing protein [Phyllobacterium sp. P30BS-XVII]MBA8904153.1 hypothetical protein [Phyllobacterium sp. P30BS-XVII]
MALHTTSYAAAEEITSRNDPVQVSIVEDVRSDLITKRVVEASTLGSADAPRLQANAFVPVTPVSVAIIDQAGDTGFGQSTQAIKPVTTNRSDASAFRCRNGEFEPATIKAMIVAEAARQDADAKLALAIADQESGFGTNVNSAAGARGIMQLMPATATHYGVTDICDAAQNIRGGIAFLKDLDVRFGGNVMLMVAAYNAGEDRVLRSGGIPSISETVNYTARVTNAYYGFDNALKGGKRAKTNRFANNQGQLPADVTELPVQNVSDGSPIPINQPKTETAKSGEWIGGSVLYVQ